MKRKVRTESVLFKCTAEEKAAIERAAIEADLSVSAYLRRLVFKRKAEGSEKE